MASEEYIEKLARMSILASKKKNRIDPSPNLLRREIEHVKRIINNSSWTGSKEDFFRLSVRVQNGILNAGFKNENEILSNLYKFRRMHNVGDSSIKEIQKIFSKTKDLSSRKFKFKIHDSDHAFTVEEAKQIARDLKKAAKNFSDTSC